MVRISRQRLGQDAEQLAFRFLRDKGLRPIRRNFRCRHGEIDLIMLDDSCLVFIEVRYRSETSFVTAMLTVDTRKQRKLSRAAAMFLAMNRRYGEHVCRFDIVGVNCGRDAVVSIDWMRDAFRPGM